VVCCSHVVAMQLQDHQDFPHGDNRGLMGGKASFYQELQYQYFCKGAHVRSCSVAFSISGRASFSRYSSQVIFKLPTGMRSSVGLGTLVAGTCHEVWMSLSL
jgi:hypothetical protein